MRTISRIAIAIVFVLFVSWAGAVTAQIPSMQELTRDVDQAATQMAEKSSSPFGFKKIEMPKPLAGLFDIRFKKPQLPNFGILDKLKSIGKPQFDSGDRPTQGPVMAGFSKLFPPRTKTGPTFLDRLMGRTGESASRNSIFGTEEMDDLKRATKELQEQVERMSRNAASNASDLFGNGQTGTFGNSPQPPLRSARQYSAEGQSRF